MAQASIYPNGYLYLSINQVEKTNGELTINEEQFDNYFNNTVGLVYYYTTGDNSVDYEGDTLVSLNASPDFRVEIDNRVGEVFSADTDANIDSLRASAVNSDGTAFAGIVKGLPSDYNGLVHRGYYLFGDDVDLETIQIPFPHVGRRDVQNIRVAMAFFDNLSLKRAFDDTDDATPIYVESSSGKRLAKIFTDTDLNFSTKVTDLETKYSVEALERTEEEDGKKPFVEQPGTAIFLSEDSVLSSHDAALAFRGWAEVVIGATAKQAEILRTDTKLLHTLSLLSDVPINGPYAQMEINKESYETGDPIEGLPNGNTYKTPINPSFKKGVIDLSSVEVYCAAYGDPAAIGKDGGDREADRRVIRLVVPFEGVTYDIDKYSVLCDVYEGDTWNWGAAGNEPPGRPKFRFMTDSTRYWVSKEESQFTIDISQEGAPYPLGTELMAQRNFPQVVDFIKGGAMKINIRVLATDE
jgi:hypothetical protein